LVKRQPFQVRTAIRVIGHHGEIGGHGEADGSSWKKEEGPLGAGSGNPLPVAVKTVGVMGDERSYENVVALRVVESLDGMTADWVRLPESILGTISNRIINEVKGVNRVVYDISSKPPSTIEWE
jgi:hypothetical protein